MLNEIRIEYGLKARENSRELVSKTVRQLGMTRKKQVEDELAAFRVFAELSAEPFDLATLVACSPPEPDLKCDHQAHGTVAIEMAELIHGEIAQVISRQPSLESEIAVAYQQAPAEVRNSITQKFGDARFIVQFDSELSFNASCLILPELMLQISKLPENAEGCAYHFGTGRLVGKIRWLDIKHEISDGPQFFVSGVTHLRDSTVDLFEQKLDANYQVSGRAELVFYNSGLLVIPAEIWLAKLRDHLNSRVECGSFQRVWAVDLQKKVVLLAQELPNQSTHEIANRRAAI